MLHCSKSWRIIVEIIIFNFWCVLAHQRSPEPIKKHRNYYCFRMPAPRPPFSSKIIKLHKMSDLLGRSLNYVEIPMNSDICLFLMKKTLSKRLIFLRKYWCFCSAGSARLGKSQIPRKNQKKVEICFFFSNFNKMLWNWASEGIWGSWARHGLQNLWKRTGITTVSASWRRSTRFGLI